VYSQSNGLHTGSARLPRRLPEPRGSYSLSEEKCTRAPPLAGTAIHNLQNTTITLFHLLCNYQLFRDNKAKLSSYLWLVRFSLECQSYLKFHHPLFFLNKADGMSNKRSRDEEEDLICPLNDSDVIYDNLEAKVWRKHHLQIFKKGTFFRQFSIETVLTKVTFIPWRKTPKLCKD